MCTGPYPCLGVYRSLPLPRTVQVPTLAWEWLACAIRDHMHALHATIRRSNLHRVFGHDWPRVTCCYMLWSMTSKLRDAHHPLPQLHLATSRRHAAFQHIQPSLPAGSRQPRPTAGCIDLQPLEHDLPAMSCLRPMPRPKQPSPARHVHQATNHGCGAPGNHSFTWHSSWGHRMPRSVKYL